MRYKIHVSGFFLLTSFFLLLFSNANGERGKDLPVPIEMVFVKGGCYQMGDTFGDSEKNEEPVRKRWKDEHYRHHPGVSEKPVHEVCVDDFYIGKYEVTVGEFREFVANTGYKTDAENGDGCFGWSGKKWEKDRGRNWRNPGFPQDDSHPVSCVSWDDAVVYAEWLSDKLAPASLPSNASIGGIKQGAGKRYRLPTEAEWEYAARSSGKAEKWAGTNNESELSDYAWYYNNSDGKTHPAGQKKPNGLGLYDMTGNVWEWVQDWYDEKYYSYSPKDNPKGADSRIYRVSRGGTWYNNKNRLRTSVRAQREPDKRADGTGFRLAASAK